MTELEKRYRQLRELGLDEDQIAKIKRIDDMIISDVRALCAKHGYGAVSQTAAMLEREWRVSQMVPR